MMIAGAFNTAINIGTSMFSTAVAESLLDDPNKSVALEKVQNLVDSDADYKVLYNRTVNQWLQQNNLTKDQIAQMYTTPEQKTSFNKSIFTIIQNKLKDRVNNGYHEKIDKYDSKTSSDLTKQYVTSDGQSLVGRDIEIIPFDATTGAFDPSKAKSLGDFTSDELETFNIRGALQGNSDAGYHPIVAIINGKDYVIQRGMTDQEKTLHNAVNTMLKYE